MSGRQEGSWEGRRGWRERGVGRSGREIERERDAHTEMGGRQRTGETGRSEKADRTRDGVGKAEEDERGWHLDGGRRAWGGGEVH